MKKYLNLLLVLVFGTTSYAQHIEPGYFASNDVNFYGYIEHSIRKMPGVEKYDKLCVSGAVFFKIMVADKKVVEIKYNTSHPPFLLAAIDTAIRKTSGHWTDIDTTVYLLPVAYIFESGCQPQNNALEAVVHMLRDFSPNAGKAGMPGFYNDPPMSCILLNPVFWQRRLE